MQTRAGNIFRRSPIIILSDIFLLRCRHASIKARNCLQPPLRIDRPSACRWRMAAERLRPSMKLVHIVGAVFLLAGGAAAQDGGKSMTKTTISLGTATPGGG